MLQGKGLLNGRNPERVYSLWSNVGTQTGFTSKAEYKQLAVKMHAAADVGDHEISFGFEYEQRKDSYWGMYADYSWDIMRLLANKHILELDSVPIYKYVDAVTGEYHESAIDPYNIGGNCEMTNLDIVEHICFELDKLRPINDKYINKHSDLITFV